MTNESLLKALERTGLLGDEVLADLRRQAAAGRVDPSSLVRQLVEAGHLTRAQGERLLFDSPAPPAPQPVHVEPDDDEFEVLDDAPPPPPTKRGPAATANFAPHDDLEVVPDDEDDLLPPPPPASKSKKPSASLAETRPADEDLGLAPLDDPLLSASTPQATVGKVRSAPKTPSETAGKKPAKKKRRTWRNEVAPAAPELANQVDDLLDSPRSADKLSALAAEERPRRGSFTAPRRNAWDSPLLLIGGGSLIGLVLLLVVLVFVMRRQTGDQALDIAEQDYKAGAYSQAIAHYNEFLEKFPHHASVSQARVRSGLAEMRQATEGARDWPRALAVTKAALDRIAPEVEFSSAQADLASILPTLTQGLADAGRQKPSPELVEQAREGAALIGKYVPLNLQNQEQMREIEGSLALTVRTLDRDKALSAAVTQMQAAKEGAAAEVYAARRSLLQAYPELADDERLTAEMVAAAERERTAVKYVAESRAALTDDVTPETVASVALTQTSGNPAPVDAGELATVLDSGAAYAVDVRTGKPRWRRFVGFDTSHVPEITKTPTGPAAVVIDSAHESVALVDAPTGKLRWRQPFDDGMPAAPVVVRDRMFVASQSGKLLTYDVASGNLRGFTQVPQPLRVAPAVDARERLLYQVGDFANLYVLSTEDGSCREVFYLGHEPQSVATVPLLIGRYLILVVNKGAEDAVLRVLLADEEGLKLKGVAEVPLRGHVYSPPVSSGRALLVATDRGALYSFELGAPDGGRILTKLAEKPPDDKPPIVPFLASRGAELWLAGYGVTRYDIQAARGTLAPKWINEDQAVVLGPPRVTTGALVFASRSPRAPGAKITAINGESGARFWETRVSVPAAAPPVLATGVDKVAVVSCAGALFDVPAAGLANRKLIDAPVAGAEQFYLQPDEPLIRLADGRCVFTPFRPEGAEIRDVLVCNLAATANAFQKCTLPEPAATRPVAFGGGLLVPGKIGQVFVVDPLTGRNLVEPFQPVVEVGRSIAWTSPLAINDKQVLISDGVAKLYRLEVVAAPRPHLAAAATVDLAAPLVAQLAVVGDFAYGVDAAGRLQSFRMPDLAPASDWPLDARVVWGPHRVGDRVLVGTLSGQLTCVDGAGVQNWQVVLSGGPLIGMPLESNGAIVAGCASGTIFRLAPTTGDVVSQTVLKQPLAVGPALWHERLLFAGSDGTLHVVAEPK